MMHGATLDNDLADQKGGTTFDNESDHNDDDDDDADCDRF